jgi:hypothetical protein
MCIYINGKMRKEKEKQFSVKWVEGNFGPAERARGHVGSRPTLAHKRRDDAGGCGDGSVSAVPRARDRERVNGIGRLTGRGEPTGVGKNRLPWLRFSGIEEVG